MRTRDLLDLLALAALWGASFLFMRYAAPAFGPFALVQVRVVIAAAFLLPLLLANGAWPALRAHAAPVLAVGVLNSAIPFVLLTYAVLSLTAGFASILNATTPLATALIGRLWLGDRIRPLQWLGLAIGIAGVTVLVWGKVDFRPGATHWQSTLAIGAALVGAIAYGAGANFTKKHVMGVAPLAVATGSQLGATIALLPFAVLFWPEAQPDARAWVAATLLAIACTGLAYLLYFRLIARVGAMRAAAVTFLIPVFATLWGAAFLSEALTLQMAGGGVVILAGTALALGLVGSGRRVDAQPESAVARSRTLRGER
ncbi:MAG TPA: DMT family transporter [Burkholderiaceae bacterium]|jgi:drug/metabolite transporter (DMT)-like permease|nr:DMT family transporter [Burkholderiaceae bacterium]